MAQASLDQNSKPTLIGVSSVDGVTPTRCRVDAVTGYLLADIKPISQFTTTSPAVKIDENANRVGAVVTDNAAQTIKPLISDPNNPGYLLADLTLI